MSVKVLTVKEDILSVNDENAKANRELVDQHHVVMINVMSSPGAGKTTLITQTINKFKEKTRMAVVEGDVASSDRRRQDKQAGHPGSADQYRRRLPPRRQHDQEERWMLWLWGRST